MSLRCWQPSWDDAQSPFGPSATKQQKLDLQAGLMSPVYSMAGSDPAVPTSHRTDNAARGAPGVLGSAPLFPSASNAGARWQPMAFNNVAPARRPPSSSTGGGLLPSPQPGLFPAPLPFQRANGWLPPGRTGLACQSVKTRPASESMSVSDESESEAAANLSWHGTARERENPAEGPAQLVIDRIYSDLDALDKKMGIETAIGNTGNPIWKLKKERCILQNKLKWERERQQIENLQLSKQLEQQYNISLGSNASQLPHTGRKQNKSTEVPKNRQTEDEATLAALSVRFAKLTCQIFDLDCKIEEVVLSEDEELGMQEKQQTLHFLRTQKKAVRRELATVKRSRVQLSKKVTEARFGLDPLLALKQLAKRVKTWKFLRSTHLHTAQDEPQEDVTMDSVEDEDDVQILSSDDSDLDTSTNNPPQQQRWRTGGKSKRYRESRCSEKKDKQVEKTVRDIEGCVRNSGLTMEVNQSYFALSALTSVLLARQRHRQSTAGTPQSAAPATPLQPCALSRLTGEINRKLNLNTRVTGARQDINVQETVNLYMKIYREPSEVCGQQTKKSCA